MSSPLILLVGVGERGRSSKLGSMHALHTMPEQFETARLAAVSAARRLLDAALDDVIALRRRVEVLAAASDWRSRAADGYRAGVADLIRELAAVAHGIVWADDEARAVEHASIAALAGAESGERCGGRWCG